MAFTGIGLPSSEGGSGAITVPSDQIFNSVADRDAFFAANPSKLVDGADCIVLTNPPEGLYQVYKADVPEWEDRTAIVEGPQGAQGVSVSTAQVDSAGDLIITLTSGANINCGRAKGEDGDLVYQELDIATYGNFFSADWGNLGTNIYGVTGLGNQFTNAPFRLNASTTYSFECLLVNEQNQYSLRVTSMANADFENAGRDAILSGLTKTSAESTGWKVYAFVSDPGHADPTEGFELQAGGNTVGLNNDGALTVRDSGGSEHNAVDNGVDVIRVGSPNMDLQLRTNQERITVENGGSDNQIAYLTDIPSPTNPEAPSRFAYWVREDEYQLTEEQIQQEIILQVQPGQSVGGDRVGTITFPSQATFTNHYHIPGVNDADAGIKPHIESFRFSVWLYYFSSESSPVKLILNSVGNWLPFVSNVSLSDKNGIYIYKENVRADSPELHTFAFMRPINYNPAVGLDGWCFHTVRTQEWIPIADQPPAQYPGSSLGTFMIDDEESSHLRTGAGITSSFDAQTGEHTLTVDPTNIDLSGYAELDSDVEFSRLVISDPADPLYETILDVTDQGNTELNMVGSSVIRAKDKASATTIDVITIADDGKLTHNTEVIHTAARDNASATSSLQVRDGDGQVMLGSVIQQTGSANPDFLAYLGDTEQAGSLQNLESTIAKFSEGRTYGFGQGSILSVSQTVVVDRVRYIIGATAPDSLTLTIDPDLIGCRVMIEAFDSLTNQFCTITVVSPGGPDITFDVGRGDRWILEASQTNDSIAYKVKNGGENPVIGMGDSRVEINEPHIRAFQYAEGMPYHLLLETPTSSRLIHEFPKAKTHRFTPIDSNRRYEGVTVNTSNEAGPVVLGQYSDIPLYTFEPNQVVNRDQVGYINFPADITIDSSEGFYFFGTVSGWAGGNQNNGTMAVYVGVNGDNPKAGASKVGFALTADRLIILTGDSSADATSATASKFNQENGVAHFYRFAVYVDNTGMMTYYIVNLNTRILHQGQQQCSLSTVLNNPKLWVAYDREAQNTSTVAVGEIHLVMNEEGDAEDLWNWRF